MSVASGVKAARESPAPGRRRVEALGSVKCKPSVAARQRRYRRRDQEKWERENKRKTSAEPQATHGKEGRYFHNFNWRFEIIRRSSLVQVLRGCATANNVTTDFDLRFYRFSKPSIILSGNWELKLGMSEIHPLVVYCSDLTLVTKATRFHWLALKVILIQIIHFDQCNSGGLFTPRTMAV